jgi:flagellum-specific ATP synthase
MTDRSLDSYGAWLRNAATVRWRGQVVQVLGNLVESSGPFCSIGESCEVITSTGEKLPGEIVGFRGSKVLSMLLGKPQGIRFGSQIVSWGTRPSIRVGPQLIGRVINATGNPLDDLGDYRAHRSAPVDAAAPSPSERVPIRDVLGCGIRAIDGMITCGRGQRVGIFGGSGVGKSTLIGMMARGTEADLTVLALVGERGREVAEFLEVLGEEGRKKSVVVVSTSDQSPVLRLRAAMSATAIAEYFAAAGKNVLLVVDSLTRFAMAQREIGLATGEPPTAKGYTPSVLNMLARLVERAGRFKTGSITAFYTVLMEGDDQQDPVVDTVRSLLDGHIILDRNLSTQGHYPPISVLNSLSRLMRSICTEQHLQKAIELRNLLATYSRSEDMIRIGAYHRGSDPALDRAIAAVPAINKFLQQSSGEKVTFSQSLEQLKSVSK